MVSALEYFSHRLNFEANYNLMLAIVKDYVSSPAKLRCILPYLLRWHINFDKFTSIGVDEYVHCQLLLMFRNLSENYGIAPQLHCRNL
jgi:hypothetical protein